MFRVNKTLNLELRSSIPSSKPSYPARSPSTATKRRISVEGETTARESTSPLPTETIHDPCYRNTARTYRFASRTFRARTSESERDGSNGVGEEWSEIGKDPSWQADSHVARCRFAACFPGDTPCPDNTHTNKDKPVLIDVRPADFRNSDCSRSPVHAETRPGVRQSDKRDEVFEIFYFSFLLFDRLFNNRVSYAIIILRKVRTGYNKIVATSVIEFSIVATSTVRSKPPLSNLLSFPISTQLNLPSLQFRSLQFP